MSKSFLPRNLIVLGASLGVLAAIAFLNYKTRNELVIDQFFLLPVAIAGWFGGRWQCWIMAGVSSLVWLWVNHLNVPVYLHPADRYWNWGLVLGRFLVAGTVVAVLREALTAAKKNLAEREAALLSLQQSTAELRAYEGQFQTICTWTNQIKDGDEWVSFPVFLSRHLHSRITHGISPDGASKLRASLKPDSSSPSKTNLL